MAKIKNFLRQQKKYAALFFFCFSPTAFADSINLGAELQEGGSALLIILGLSILAVAVTIERALHLREKFLVPSNLAARAKTLWAQKKFSELQIELARDSSALSKLIQYMFKHRTQNRALISAGVSDLASMEMRYHQQRAYPLSIVATVAPIVGLLGTVIGMIEAFHVIAYAEGMGNPALLAGGISKALINTASGLSVALPALAMHHFFKHRAVFFSLALEKNANELIDEWFMSNESPALNESIGLNEQGSRHAD